MIEEKPELHFYVTYTYTSLTTPLKNSTAIFYAASEIITDKDIYTYEDIIKIADTIKDKHNLGTVVILDWKRICAPRKSDE